MIIMQYGIRDWCSVNTPSFINELLSDQTIAVSLSIYFHSILPCEQVIP